MKKLIPFLAALIITVIYFGIQRENPVITYGIGTEDNPNARAEYEYLVMRDPVADEIPANIRKREMQLARKLPLLENFVLAKGSGLQPLLWDERGPDNIGGRTRTFAADIANPGVLIAGGVDGGIWKSTDDGASWSLRLRPDQTHSTTCIAQDKRPGKTHIWYVGTGEFRGSTTNNTRWGAFYHGDGIYKSTNNGDSWELLPSTISGTPHIADDFDFIWNIATNPANTVEDEVFAATWRGIYRSTNGGNTWNLSKASDIGTVNTSTVTTEVVAGATGVIYAHTRENGVLKLWRSEDGVNWNSIAPANFPTSSGRVVIAIAPSNENIVYFFVQGPNNTPATAGHQIWKYTHSSLGGTWENRSANLPSDLSTQTGYDMILHIKPDNPDFVLIGGTNLYRSTDGFTTTNYSTIGGYPYYSQAGDTHHPDLQGGMFKPTNPNVYYSTTDGGIHRANNINLPEPMAWESLNNGYNVTQVYSVAISPDSGDNMIVAGAQDNGSLATDSSDTWYEIYGGDGTLLELAPVADDRRYTQYQNGPIQRQTRTMGNVTTITPSGSTRQLFVNPIALDPNNSSILYYGAGKSTAPAIYSGIWRNDNVQNATTSSGWQAITASDVGTVTAWTRRVSAIGVSKYNSPNVVYIGTTDGIVKRIDNANSSSPTATDITPPGLNGGTAQGGFVRCIAVSHYNSSYALVAYGNYNFKSLWLTTDGGATWTDVEGNISGPDGPSVRWATFVPNGDDINVFIGTSIGLLMTERLQGSSTVWVHAAANEIGNVLIAYMDYRESDRTLVVGTHGRGVFTTKVPGATTSVKEAVSAPAEIVLGQNHPNPFNASTKIKYTVPSVETGLASTGSATGAPSPRVRLTVYDVRGREVATLVDEEQAAGSYEVEFNPAQVDNLRYNGLSSGIYFYQLRVGSDVVNTKKMILMK